MGIVQSAGINYHLFKTSQMQRASRQPVEREIAMRKRVVILTGHSLFAEGLISRLKEHNDRLVLHVVSPADDGDYLAKIIALHPYVIIRDSSEVLAASGCSLGALLQKLPTVKIICLDPKEDEIQIVTSEQRQAGKALELLEMIEQAA